MTFFFQKSVDLKHEKQKKTWYQKKRPRLRALFLSKLYTKEKKLDLKKKQIIDMKKDIRDVKQTQKSER